MEKIAICQLPYQNEFSFQQELLLFDKIIIPHLLYKQRIRTFENLGWKDELNMMLANVDFLIKNGKIEIVDIAKQIDKNVSFLQNEKNINKLKNELSDKQLDIFVNKLKYAVEKEKYIKTFFELRDKIRNNIENSEEDKGLKIIAYTSLKKKYDANVIELASIYNELVNPNKRLIPVKYQDKYEFLVDNIDIKLFNNINKEDIEILKNTKQKSYVTNIVLKKMPKPTNMPLKEIIDFRNKDRNIRKLNDLNRWINNIIRADMSKSEIESEIEYLMSEYERIYKLNNIRYNYSKTQIIINTTLGTLEKIIKIKWSELANSFFEIKKAKIDKELIETQAIGRELAYLLEVKKITTANNIYSS